MKAMKFILCLSLALAMTFSCAQAALNLSGVRATPIRDLAIRTGPGTSYTEFDMMPQSTRIAAIELEEGDGATWALVEFMFGGKRVRGYTGLKRMNLAGYVPYARHEHLLRTVVNDVDVLDAPDHQSGVRAYLRAGSKVDFLGFEGDYCLIEFNYGAQKMRGYISNFAFWIDQYEYDEYFPDTDAFTWYAIDYTCPMYEGPSEKSNILFNIPFDACVTVDYYEHMAAPDGWIPIYYGGLKGYGRESQFSDLSFPSPEYAKEFN